MPTPTLIFVPFVVPLRDTLRGYAPITRIAAQRVFVGKGSRRLNQPWLQIRRVGGGPDLTYDEPVVQFNCYAPEHGEANAEALAAAVVTWLLNTPPHTRLADGLEYMGADEDAITTQDLPDPEDDTPRYVVTAPLSLRIVESEAVVAEVVARGSGVEG